MRRVLVGVSAALAGLFLFVGGLSLWLKSTVYDSSTFASRVTSVLESDTVRHEIAERLTEELVKAGNQQAISYRPAMATAVETVLDTDTFQAIFGDAEPGDDESISGDSEVPISTDDMSLASPTLPDLADPCAAFDALRAAGLDDDDLDELAVLAQVSIAELGDGASASGELEARVVELVGRERFDEAVTDFVEQIGPADTGAIDGLTEIPVSLRAGLGCAPVEAIDA